MLRLLLAAYLACSVTGVMAVYPDSNSCKRKVSSDAEAFASTKFDYVVIGGGTAGMALAARLAENPRHAVGVLEAGQFLIDDPVISTPAFCNTPNIQAPKYDWGFTSIPQSQAGERTFAMSRGKMLGGSSGTNFMAFTRASSVEYDVWKTFAPRFDWTWNGLLPFFKKSETVPSPSKDPFLNLGNLATPANSSTQTLPGVKPNPITGSFNDFYFDPVGPYVQSLNALGVRTNTNSRDGNATGVFNSVLTVDRKYGTRSYSPIGYLCGQDSRPNLKVLVGAQATKINFAKDRATVIAKSVQFSSGSTVYTVRAEKEVILSAGTVQTPQLLELSGIGKRSLLSSMNITTVVDLPSVGENLQEHLFTAAQWKLKPGHLTYDKILNNVTFAHEQMELYNKTGTGLYAALDSVLAFIPLGSVSSPARVKELLQVFDKSVSNTPSSSLASLQRPIHRSWVAGGKVAEVELILWSRGVFGPEANESYIFVLGGLTHTLGRGYVHITSPDPFVQPAINPSYLDNDYDVQVLLDINKFMQKIGKQKPLSDMVDRQTVPDPSLQSDEDLISFIRQSSAGGHHLIGTAAMGPRDRGGVVDSNLKVYGTQNLRVVDASVIPLHISAHIQATVYAIAEKAAHIILSGN